MFIGLRFPFSQESVFGWGIGRFSSEASQDIIGAP